MSKQQIGSIGYERPIAKTSSPTELETEYQIEPGENPNEINIKQYMTFDPDAVAQVDTVGISLGAEGDYYVIEADDGVVSEAYAYRQTANDTASTVASKLAQRIDLHPGVRAIASDSSIILTGVVPGLPIAYDNSDSTNSTNITLMSNTAPFGTPNFGLVTDAIVKFEIGASGYIKLTVSGGFYDGMTTPTKVNALGPLTAKSSITVDSMQTIRGVERTVS